jgi:hypothetical protein
MHYVVHDFMRCVSLAIPLEKKMKEVTKPVNKDNTALIVKISKPKKATTKGKAVG